MTDSVQSGLARSDLYAAAAAQSTIVRFGVSALLTDEERFASELRSFNRVCADECASC
jgi:hypothetical protein